MDLGRDMETGVPVDNPNMEPTSAPALPLHKTRKFQTSLQKDKERWVSTMVAKADSLLATD